MTYAVPQCWTPSRFVATCVRSVRRCVSPNRMDSLRHTKSLECLFVKDCPTAVDGSFLPALDGLRALLLEGASWSTEDMPSTFDLLRWLLVDQYPNALSAAVIANIASGLVHLELDRCHGIEAFDGPHLSWLSSLRISGCGGLRVVQVSALSRLCELY